ANVNDAGFDLDAIQALTTLSGPYVILEGVIIDDTSGNNNGMLDAGETVEYLITLKNVGSENAIDITGKLSCIDLYVSVITISPQAFGTLGINESATATYTVTADENTPAGHSATLELVFDGANVTPVTKYIEVLFPDYCDASTNTEDEYIANVLCGNINNPSGWQGGVANYTGMSTAIEPGMSESITITNGNAWATDRVSVWVDWDMDMDLGNGTAETFVLTNVGGTGATFEGSINVPDGQATGSYRMRIRMTYNTDPQPCGSSSHGEIEDYTIIIEPAQQLNPPQNLSALVQENDVLLTWETPEARLLTGYNVYRDEVLIAENILPTAYTDEDLNPGTYGYYVKAVYDEGLSESTATVFATIEDMPETFFSVIWSTPFNPMTFYILQATLDESDLQAGDEIGLFDTDQSTGEPICVGAGILTEAIVGGTYLEIIASMNDGSNPDMANGFTPGNEIHYRFWTGPSGELTSVSATYPYPGYDQVYTSQGSAFAELSGVTTTFQSLTLQTGWNLMSFNVEPENRNMLDIVQPLIDQDILYKVIDETGGSIFHLPFPPPNGQWSNTIGDMANTEGYYVKITDDATLSAVGYPVDLPMNIPLSEGWNIIGYPCNQAQDAMEAVQPLIDEGILYKVIDEAGGVIFHLPFPPPNGQWANSIGNFESGKGYYIKVTEEASLTFTEPVLNSKTIKPNH
nr:fibronectin type III domain-containing protein [Bacteroidota bacterium]